VSHLPYPRRSLAEIELQRLLRERPLRFPVKVQYRIHPYTLDFFIPEIKLAVEIDGAWHLLPETMEKDVRRNRVLEGMGIAVLHIDANLAGETMQSIIEDVIEKTLRMTTVDRITFTREYKHQPPLLDAVVDATNKKKLAHPDCLDCAGNGWKMVPVWNEKRHKAEERAAKCDCANLRVTLPFDLSLELVPVRPIQLELLPAKDLFHKSPQADNLFTAESLRNRA
jgi:very-short-patch-repair endonuclease